VLVIVYIDTIHHRSAGGLRPAIEPKRHKTYNKALFARMLMFFMHAYDGINMLHIYNM